MRASLFPADHLAKLNDTLESALRDVPAYASWRAKDPGAAAPVLERLAALPTLTRRNLRLGFPKSFVPAGLDFKAAQAAGDVEVVATSGTTDDRVQVLWHTPWWEQQERAQYLEGHAATRGVWGAAFKEAVLTTPVCASGVCHMGDLPMQERISGRMLFLNSKADPAYWTEKDLARMAEELATYAPDAFEVDPAYGAALARWAVRKGVKLPAVKYVGLTYEFPSRVHLAALREAFPGATLIDSYGSTEAGCVVLGESGKLLQPNLGFTHLEVLPLAAKHGGPRVGRIVVSVLGNPWLKLLRYETGDLALLPEVEALPEGGGLPLARIEGRLKDATFATDGSLVTVAQLDEAIGAPAGLEGWQLVQSAKDRVRLRVVLRDATLPTEVLERVRALYRGAEVELRTETSIPPEGSGKYRLAVSELPFDAAALFA